jgi:prepilin-type N-terminal cleavage/methylation domain-containing protein
MTRIQERKQWDQAGFSIIELMVALTILLAVSGVVMGGLMQMSYTQGTITNRSEMHASVRSATELLQQEIGQAGRISLPTAGPTKITTPINVVDPSSGLTLSVTLDSATGVFNGMLLVVDASDKEETVAVSNLNTTTRTFTGTFHVSHAANAKVQVSGAFASGIVPTTTINGSTGSILKLYGDVNDDGNMVYVEYKCDTAAGKLYRNSMTYDAVSKPLLNDSLVLLPNIQSNPDGTPCFTYQQQTVGTDTYVTNVAVTLTVQTELKDPKTKQYQQETKALLNVSPRNVFEGWQLASAGIKNRIQPMPASVTALLP